MNRHLEIVHTVRANASAAPVDLHEFRLTDEGTALITGYEPRLHGSTWILDSIFREVDVQSGEILFKWSALNHVDLSDSLVPPGNYGTLGDGRHHYNAWDFFHINSIDKSAAGDYLISSRHTDTIFKVSQIDGSILWRLNGRRSSFEVTGLTFRRQHDARFLEETRDRTIISIFDNDNDGFTVHGVSSTALIVEIDHQLGVARILTRLAGPTPEGLVTDGMGSFSVQRDGNMFVSWGADSQMAEYLPDGTVIFHANMGWDSRNYRAYKAACTGMPRSPPDLWTASESFRSRSISYVSWNGATEVRTWRFHASQKEHGPYQIVGSVSKINFETRFEHSRHWAWTFVEALDQEGRSLGNSTATETTVLNLRDVDLLDDCEPSPCILGVGCQIEERPK